MADKRSMGKCRSRSGKQMERRKIPPQKRENPD
jgi:hypothetical protein